jgi:subtilisin family serine protease
MINKKVSRSLVLLLSIALVLTSFGFGALANNEENAASSAESSAKSFVVAFKTEELPQNVATMVNKAGGEISYEVPEIGVIEVTSENPTPFIKAMLGNKEVLSLVPSIEIPLDLPEVEVSGASITSATPDPVPVDQNIWESGWQWDIEKLTNNFASHDVHSGTHDVVVGIIDTGIDFNHPDLRDNIVPGSKTFVPGTTDALDAHSHGTHVAGTIAANGRLKGIAPNVGIRAYRVFNTGGAQQIWITNAIIAAANDGVDVINMSLGGVRVKGQWYYTDPTTGEKIRLGGDAADVVAYNRAVRYAVERNVTVVAAAGNAAQDMSNPAKVADWYNEYLHSIGYTQYEVQGAASFVPAQIPGVITVSATGGGFGTDDRLAFFSNYGSGVIDVAAPGGDAGPVSFEEEDWYKYLVLSTVPTYLAPTRNADQIFGETGYGWKAGTSMASPQVAGTAAAYISYVYETTGKKPKPSQVQTRLQQTAEEAGKIGYDEAYGHGIVNVFNVLKK